MVVFCPVIMRLALAWLSSRAPSTCLHIYPGALDTRTLEQVQQDPQRMLSPLPAMPNTMIALSVVLPICHFPWSAAGGE